MIKQINSANNEMLKTIKALHNSAARHQTRQFIAEGTRICETLLQHQRYSLQYCLLTKEHLPWAKQKEIDEKKLILLPEALLKRVSALTTANGILCVFAIPETKLANLQQSLVLHELHDPGNVGTLIRTAAALGLKQVILVGGVDPWNPKVIQASAGTIAAIDIIQSDWQQIKKLDKDANLCALIVKNGKSPDLLKLPATLVIGNEANGLPAEVIAACAQACTLSMPGGTESLNAAVAGSIALYIANFPAN